MKAKTKFELALKAGAILTCVAIGPSIEEPTKRIYFTTPAEALLALFEGDRIDQLKEIPIVLNVFYVSRDIDQKDISYTRDNMLESKRFRENLPFYRIKSASFLHPFQSFAVNVEELKKTVVESIRQARTRCDFDDDCLVAILTEVLNAGNEEEIKTLTSIDIQPMANEYSLAETNMKRIYQQNGMILELDTFNGMAPPLIRLMATGMSYADITSMCRTSIVFDRNIC